MIELATRSLGDGSQTTITLYHDDDRCIIEAVNVNGTSSAVVSEAEAWDAFMHPFCNPERLDYPQRNVRSQQRLLTPTEYALVEALNEVEDEVEA